MTINTKQVKSFSVYKELELEKTEKIKYAYASVKMTRKQSNKIIELLQQEVSLLFDKKPKTNVLFIKDKNKNVVGSIQKIVRKSQRFDTTAFKEKFPKLFNEFLVPSESCEFKPVLDEVLNEQQ
jgi:hypothetical protein